MDRACAAKGHSAAVFRAGKTKIVPDHPQKRRIDRYFEFIPSSIHVEGNHEYLSWTQTIGPMAEMVILEEMSGKAEEQKSIEIGYL
jgi:Tfp pilus assembly protein PilO